VSSDQLYVKFDDSSSSTTTRTSSSSTAMSSRDTSDTCSSSSSTKNTHIATLSDSDVFKDDDGTNDNRSCQGKHEDECKVNEGSKTVAVKPSVPTETKSKLSFNEPLVKDLDGFKQYLLREGVEVIIGGFCFYLFCFAFQMLSPCILNCVCFLFSCFKNMLLFFPSLLLLLLLLLLLCMK
jgi:hypothetical protein